MNNTDTLEKIIRHQKNKDPAYPFLFLPCLLHGFKMSNLLYRVG
ncbi:hypothetical protein AC24_4941 [Escherichia coli 8-415-05_S3_C2]|nr:hypothetical protein AC24_4941 [Escherichia coli 8-415-05_S3_C2]